MPAKSVRAVTPIRRARLPAITSRNLENPFAVYKKLAQNAPPREVAETICAKVLNGCDIYTASNSVGIPKDLALEWLHRGDECLEKIARTPEHEIPSTFSEEDERYGFFSLLYRTSLGKYLEKQIYEVHREGSTWKKHLWLLRARHPRAWREVSPMSVESREAAVEVATEFNPEFL